MFEEKAYIKEECHLVEYERHVLEELVWFLEKYGIRYLSL